MTALIIGYTRVSTNEQDLTAQRSGLAALGVPAIPSSSPSWTGSLGLCPMPGISSKTSPSGT
jgi:hypothetical protein